MARISCMAGSMNTRTQCQRAPTAPRSRPPAAASRKPAIMRSALNTMRCQNAAVGASCASAPSVCRGVARNSPPCPSPMAANCQIRIHTRMAAAFCHSGVCWSGCLHPPAAAAAGRCEHRPLRGDLACIVEVVGRQGAAHAGGVGGVQNLEVGLEVGLHLVAGLKNDVALRQGLLGQRSLGDNAVLLAEGCGAPRGQSLRPRRWRHSHP